MNLNFNFCSPAFPNDPTIQIHRTFQSIILISILVVYAFFYAYYYLTNHQPETESRQKSSNEKMKRKDSNMEQKKQTISTKGGEEISKKEKTKNEVNLNQISSAESVSVLKGSLAPNFVDKIEQQAGLPKEGGEQSKLKNLQSYFPIVYGHLSISIAVSLLYSPQFWSSLLILIIGILSIIILISNSLGRDKCLRYLWISKSPDYLVMAFMILWLLIMGMVGIGQTDYSEKEKKCYAHIY